MYDWKLPAFNGMVTQLSEKDLSKLCLSKTYVLNTSNRKHEKLKYLPGYFNAKNAYAD